MTMPEKKILLLSNEASAASIAIRAVVEDAAFAAVHMHLIGTPNDLIHILNTSTDYGLILLCCHGKDGNIAMPEFADFVQAEQLITGDMTPEDVRKNLKLTGQKVFSMGCSTGFPEMAEAFLDVGCEWYIAPDDYPEGSAGIIFAINLLYNYLCCEQSIENAIDNSKNDYDSSRFYKLYI